MSRSQSTKRKKNFAMKLWDQRALVCMSIPALVLVIVFQYIPMYGITIAFQRFNPIKGFFNTDIDWVGLKYFAKFFQTPYVFRLLKNNLIISLEDLIIGFPLPIVLAILLDQLQLPRYKKVVQTISYADDVGTRCRDISLIWRAITAISCAGQRILRRNMSADVDGRGG